MSAMMLLEWWCDVQQVHSLRKAALLEPTGVAAEPPVTPARWKEGEKSMARMRDVLDDVSRLAQAVLVINVLDGG